MHKETSKYVALKIIDKEKTPRRVLMMLQTEIRAMKALAQHPNILCLLSFELSGVYPRKSGGTKDVVCLALELAEGGELFDFMMYTGAFSEAVSRTIFHQLISALAFCHDKGIYHRDIKPENLLLTSDFQLKVADFGLASMKPSAEELLKTECGTRSYMAPEVLARKQYDGSKSDCWSAGVVLFIMLSGNPPFQMARPGDWWFNQLSEGRPDRFWRSHKRYCPNFPDGAQSLLNAIFTPDPTKRPSVKDLLSNPWVTTGLLTPEELKHDLYTRKQKVILEKQAEKERARKKATEAKGGAEYDPFAKDKRRSTADDLVDGNEVEVEIETVVAPPLKGEVKGFTNFYTSERIADVLTRLIEATEQLQGKILNKQDFSIRAIVPLPSDPTSKVEIEYRIFSVPEEKGVKLVEVVKTLGDTIAFNMIYKKLKAALVDLHGETEEAMPAKNVPMPIDPSEENPEKDGDVDDNVDMI